MNFAKDAVDITRIMKIHSKMPPSCHKALSTAFKLHNEAIEKWPIQKQVCHNEELGWFVFDIEKNEVVWSEFNPTVDKLLVQLREFLDCMGSDPLAESAYELFSKLSENNKRLWSPLGKWHNIDYVLPKSGDECIIVLRNNERAIVKEVVVFIAKDLNGKAKFVRNCGDFKLEDVLYWMRFEDIKLG